MQGETEKLVTEMTEAEEEAERQVELEDKIPARFYIRKVELEATLRIVPGARRRCGGRPSRSTQRRAELASSRRWLTTIGS